MPSGPSTSATDFEVALTWTLVQDPSRARRLAAILFSPSTGESTGGGR